GWLLTSKEIGECWAREQAPLKAVPENLADAAALTLVRADETKVLRRLIRAARQLNPGRRVFFLREYADGVKRARQASVLNVPHGARSQRAAEQTDLEQRRKPDMPIIFIDRLSHIGFYNGVLRIECAEASATGQERPSGTLMIPGNQARQVLQSLLKAAEEIDKKLREQHAQQQPTVGTA